MSQRNILLYGANGYTGQLIARLSVERGLKFIIAGRDRAKIETLAAELNLPHLAFTLDDTSALDAALKDVAAVLHCAGPFSHTSKQMADACLRHQSHYLDITGEIAVFESLAARDAEARSANVMLLPGTGFDVVPSDCLAAHLKRRLPSATKLTLGIQGLGRLSHGTATTVVENINRGGLVRRDGRLTPVPAAWKTRMIDFGRGPVSATTIPWGDVATAYHSTGIPNIEVYAAMPAAMRRMMKASRLFGRLLKTPAAQNFLKRRIKAQPAGPGDDERAKGKSFVWGEAEDASGQRVASRLQGPEGYTLTALTALAIAARVLAGDAPAGFQTPSRAYGADFILNIEGVRREDVETI
ncbi:MAG TPA: saccharopine dehydrogenase NADP-binding domain-containing protein [Pyrinomonadaceae bacterium]|nr:saccharopine dehydrogenase NADP-binding domain-containing protein [Pyrinomonadaceae bacterium]